MLALANSGTEELKWEGEETMRASLDVGRPKNLELFAIFFSRSITQVEICAIARKSSALRPCLIREVQRWSF